MRGNSGVVGFTRCPGLMPSPYGARASFSSTLSRPRIFFDVTGMNGSSVSATTRNPSTRLARICATRGSLAGSLASVNGEVATMYLLAASSACQMASRARLNASSSTSGATRDGIEANVSASAIDRAASAPAARRRRDLAFEVSRRHREHAAGQIAEVVGQVRVVAIDHALLGEVAVEAVGEFAQDEEAQNVGADVF